MLDMLAPLAISVPDSGDVTIVETTRDNFKRLVGGIGSNQDVTVHIDESKKPDGTYRRTSSFDLSADTEESIDWVLRYGTIRVRVTNSSGSTAALDVDLAREPGKE